MQLLRGRPCFPLPSTFMLAALLMMWSSSLRRMCPYHLSLFSWICLCISVTLVLPLISLFSTLSRRVWPQAHLSILISVVFSFLSCAFFIAQVSAPYVMAGLTATLYTFPALFADSFRSHFTPDSLCQFRHPAWNLYSTSIFSSSSVHRVDPRYLKFGLAV